MSRGFFGVGIYHPKNSVNIGTLWRSAKIFNASYIFTVGRRYKHQPSDTEKAWRHIPFFSFTTFDEMKEKLPFDTRLVAVELTDGATPLASFKHPQRAAYILGAEDYGIPENILSKCHDTIVLPGKSSMNVSVAGSIVMFHRGLNNPIHQDFERKYE